MPQPKASDAAWSDHQLWPGYCLLVYVISWAVVILDARVAHPPQNTPRQASRCLSSKGVLDVQELTQSEVVTLRAAQALRTHTGASTIQVLHALHAASGDPEMALKTLTDEKFKGTWFNKYTPLGSLAMLL
jgi:hypothetical protein